MALWIICSTLVASGNGLLLIYFHCTWGSEEKIAVNFYPWLKCFHSRIYTYKCRLPMFRFVLLSMYQSGMKHTILRCRLHHLSFVGYNCCIDDASVSSAAITDLLVDIVPIVLCARHTAILFPSAPIFWQIIYSAWFHCIYMSGSLTRGGGKNVPGNPTACAIHNFTYLARGLLHESSLVSQLSYIITVSGISI